MLIAALTVTAYVVGVRISSLVENFQDAVKWLRGKLPSWLRPSGSSGHIPPQVDAVIQEIAIRYPSNEEGDDVAHLRAVYRSCIDQAVAEAKFRWPAEAADLFQEYDRRESERDFAYGISVPLATLAFVLVVTGTGWSGVALALVVIALLSKQAGFRHQRELERFVLEAVMVGRIRSDLTKLLLDWGNQVGRPLVKPF
ncbi:hypothetical protein GCE86_24675 [Micromonospora terminaliae]|uniref:Uncharacterized protein n=1 Tax=Micromonospora terminaliae TaxID=1914461 RepID=A0AAJ2ZH09_9ACTN|nr:hypothetical protein [Micromonospora terminaliae]NES29892.1 hypothetical protein [Micromonospora terminaliae]QGL49932.1 hypothetical protein GCE86_24675 [Micromonospora terminaliae]